MNTRSIFQGILVVGTLSIIASCGTPAQKVISEKEIVPSSMQDMMNNTNTSSCDNKTTQELKDQCLDNIALMKAKSSNDPVACTSIKDKETLGACLAETQKTNASKDTDGCTGILDMETKKSCISTLQLTEAMNTMNITLCDNIEDVSKRTNCKSTITFSEAVTKKDPSLCLKLEDINQQKSCKESIK